MASRRRSCRCRDRRRRQPHRPEALDLLQRPPRRRALLPGLPGAAHVPALPQDGRRARRAHRRGAGHPQGLPLGRPRQPADGGRQAGAALPRHAGEARRAGRDARAHLREGAEQDPGPGQAPPAHRRADRQGELALDVGRREGRRLRGPAGAERPGREGRRGPVLHAAAAHRGHRGLRAARAGRGDHRPRLRHRRLPPRRPRLPRQPLRARPRRRSGTCASTPCAASSWWTASRACAR